MYYSIFHSSGEPPIRRLSDQQKKMFIHSHTFIHRHKRTHDPHPHFMYIGLMLWRLQEDQGHAGTNVGANSDDFTQVRFSDVAGIPDAKTQVLHCLGILFLYHLQETYFLYKSIPQYSNTNIL